MLLLFFCSKKVSKKGALQLEKILHPSLIQSGKFQNSEQMNLPLKQLKFSSLFHNAGPEAFLLGPKLDTKTFQTSMLNVRILTVGF